MDAMRGYSVFARKGRSVYYVTYLSAETGAWKQEATTHRTDDPLGFKKASRHGEQLAQRFFRTAQTNHQECWAAWVRPYLIRRFREGTKTHTRYICAWDNLLAFITEHKLIRPIQWRYTHNQDYIDWRTTQVRNNGKYFTRNTAIFELKLLGQLMREALRRGFILVNNVEKIGIPRDPPKEKRELTDEDISKLRAFVAAKEKQLPIEKQWQTVSLEIALHQGCRLMETGVPMSDVDETAGRITFRGKGRNGVARVFTTQLHPNLVPLVKQLRRAGATHTCHLPKMAGKIWFFDFREAGVDGASFHCTRVTVITRLARSGVPEQHARRYVNHASKAVHSVYQKLKAEDLGSCTQALTFAERPGQSPGAAPAKP